MTNDEIAALRVRLAAAEVQTHKTLGDLQYSREWRDSDAGKSFVQFWEDVAALLAALTEATRENEELLTLVLAAMPAQSAEPGGAGVSENVNGKAICTETIEYRDPIARYTGRNKAKTGGFERQWRVRQCRRVAIRGTERCYQHQKPAP